MRGHDAGSSGRKPSGGSSSTGKRTEAGTRIVSGYGSAGIWGMLARRVRGGKTRLAKARSVPAKRVAGPGGVALRCNSACHAGETRAPTLPRVGRRHAQRPRLERLDAVADLRRALELELLRGVAHLLAQRGHALGQLRRRQRRELVLLLGDRDGQVVRLAHRGQRLGYGLLDGLRGDAVDAVVLLLHGP